MSALDIIGYGLDEAHSDVGSKGAAFLVTQEQPDIAIECHALARQERLQVPIERHSAFLHEFSFVCLEDKCLWREPRLQLTIGRHVSQGLVQRLEVTVATGDSPFSTLVRHSDLEDDKFATTGRIYFGGHDSRPGMTHEGNVLNWHLTVDQAHD